ncbi:MULTISPECIES: DUF3019 domain-containing protein [unclassified Pseudoalteromonas]|uniref:DUF3019 domain-containing protein n=1 Tax=unclassified Pseudoalteromonas TaxID=194690 RepID=UPI0012863D2B|nr:MULTISPECIES: DUF3019 domain-containing protein [unclassified Pseudoalteromonas]MBC7009490.1 DUF3019 domain-containing protein [Pseudoalteromonas sp. BZK2]MCF2845760.1 DUF3019 domain-containing protein [Pseudoalteromonas sp. PAST1]MCH2089026.1 DUF3019 domain-containing protein [Pseudoalteromonas sp.]MCO7209115.1 DUF3019 domain-containing protein [Pseudoalteromonas sp. ACER1]TMP14845.1 hypothetical protein CWC02_17570 [Pseudoalteromonas sp. S2721]
MMLLSKLLSFLLICSLVYIDSTFAKAGYIEVSPENCVTAEQDCVMDVSINWYTEVSKTVCIRVTDQQIRLFCHKPSQGQNFAITVQNNRNIVLELLSEQLEPLESTEISLFHQHVKKRRRDIAWSIF